MSRPVHLTAQFEFPLAQPEQARGDMWEFPKLQGTLFWGPDNKDPTI